MSNNEPAVRIRSYGGLRLWRSGAEVDIGAPRLRTLLAALLAARGGGRGGRRRARPGSGQRSPTAR